MPQIRYSVANLRGLGSDFVLRPGLNDVPDHVFEQYAENPQILDLIKQGKIEVLDPSGKAIKPPSSASTAPASAPAKGKPGRKPKAKAEPEAPAQETAKAEPEAPAAKASSEPTDEEIAALAAAAK